MLGPKYSLVIEATDDPNFFGFYSPDLEGFAGVGNSIEDCIYKATWGMEEHLALLKEEAMSARLPRSIRRSSFKTNSVHCKPRRAVV
jgi:predicted RNase H-like HicB family nuclease